MLSKCNKRCNSVCKSKTAAKFSLIPSAKARSQRIFVSDKSLSYAGNHPKGNTTLCLLHSARALRNFCIGPPFSSTSHQFLWNTRSGHP